MSTRTRIVALGDSTTAGTPGFLSPVEAPPSGSGDETSQYAYWLERCRPEWQVLNRGVNRERIEQIAARVTRDVLAEHPAAVIVIAGVNDIYDGDAADEVTERLAHLYRLLREAGLPVVAGTILPFDTATPAHNDVMRAVNAWIAAHAGRTDGLWACDTRAAVARVDNPDLLGSSPDGLHPSVDGYRRMAEALAPVVARALDAAPITATAPTR